MLWLDLFLYEYGWSIKDTLSHTFYQLKVLADAIEQRRSADRLLNFNLYRVAQHGNGKQVDEFIKTISTETKPKASSSSVSKTPEGFKSG